MKKIVSSLLALGLMVGSQATANINVARELGVTDAELTQAVTVEALAADAAQAKKAGKIGQWVSDHKGALGATGAVVVAGVGSAAGAYLYARSQDTMVKLEGKLADELKSAKEKALEDKDLVSEEEITKAVAEKVAAKKEAIETAKAEEVKAVEENDELKADDKKEEKAAELTKIEEAKKAELEAIDAEDAVKALTEEVTADLKEKAATDVAQAEVAKLVEAEYEAIRAEFTKVENKVIGKVEDEA